VLPSLVHDGPLTISTWVFGEWWVLNNPHLHYLYD
jgi:hypothetical protein